MMWVSSFVLVFLSWLIFAVSSHAITNELQCSRYCKENRNDFGYENGWVYSYKYTTKVTTFINSSSDLESLNKNVVSLSVLVDIHTLSTCDYKLQLSDAQIFTINKASAERISGDFEKRLTKNPLHFSFHNGKINTVCSVTDEEIEVLNIKKAILSAFQHSKQYLLERSILYETDISGICETEYETIENESHYAVKKTKNLESCSHRSEKYFSWQSEPYNKKQASSSPLIRSTQNCLQIYQDNMILKSSTCEERHLFQPFSNGEQGAITMLNQNLEFIVKKHIEPNSLLPLEFERGTLLYKKVESTTEKNSNIDDVLKLLSMLELNTNDGIKPDVSALFFKIVNSLEDVSKEGLGKIFESIRNSPKKKKFFLDALPLITTPEGIEFLITLKRQDELTQAEFDSWMSSLLFIKNPSLEVLQTLSTLANSVSHVNQKSVLTISGLLYRYCKANQCRNNERILNIMRVLEEPLKTGCNSADPVSQANILLALKAIGNAGITTSFGNLRACFLKSDVPIDLRLAAITAHRRINCDQNENLDYFQNTFSDIKENTEVRIASYLNLMQCSSYAVFTNVRHVLYKEEINQVGSFVWTHLTNLQETTCQWKQKLKALVENEFLRNKFDTDLRKYSRNYELSYFFDSINTGVSAESNVVFTADSYLPKSGMLNLTLDIFGETVNVFEVGGRLTGFEDVIEELFGPEGYFPESSMKSLLENARSEHELVQKIHELGESMKSQKMLKRDPSGLLYAKIFGNEISYTHFKSVNEVFGGESINKRSAFDLLRKLFSSNDVEYTKMFKFLDSTFTIPTLAGFPLEVSVNGTATLGLTIKGKVDVQDFWNQKLQVEGKIYPSAVVEIEGAMTVDAFSTKMGLKSASTANSNTYIDGHVFIDGGKLVDLKLNVPKKQMDIINIESKLFLFQNANSTILEDVTSNVEEWEGCTRTLFGKITGLQFCSNYKYVNASQEKYAPYFPLTGSFKYSVSVKKVDVFDSYHTRWSSNLDPGTDLNYVSFYLDTPNSRVNRKFNVSVYLDKKGKTLEAKLEHPFATMELLCRLENGLNVKVLYNNKEIVFLESFLYLLQNEYKIDAKLNYKEETLATISGIISTKNNKYTMQFVVNEAKISLAITPMGGTYVVTSEVHSKELQASLNASVVLVPDMFSLTSKCSYNYKNKRDDLFLEFNVGKAKKIESVKGILYLNFVNTFKPFYNTLISFSVERSEMYFEVVGKVVLFDVTWDTNQLLKFRQGKDYLDVALLSTLTCLQKNIDYKIVLSHNSTKDDFGLNALVQLNRIQRVEVLVKYETFKEDRNIAFLIYYPKQAWSINGALKKVSLEEIDIKLKGLQETDGVAVEFLNVEGKYMNSTREQLKNYTLNLAIDFVRDAYFWKSPWIINSSLQNSKDIFISSAELRSNAFNTSASITQTKDTFRTEFQLNNRKLFVVNSKTNGDETSITLGLNIYQNFEFNAKMKPYTHLDVKFYWDKDRDPNQKLFFTIVGNNNGFFVINLEYPNQKVVASFTLLPTQVTLNVTWGLQVYQKIYLKLGNKIYDVGGIWYGELETPFKYFEKQKFRLKYLVFKQNIETETSISWRDHKINLTAAGSRLPSSLSGFLEINSTLPQIKKIGVAVSHTSASINSTKESKTNVAFVYNQHQVTAESVWSSQGLNVLSTFQVVSSTETIKPIYGVLVINNNETNNYFNCEFSWQGSNVSAEYKFENSRSYIVIKTPFKGVEKTKLEYALVRSPSDLMVEIEVNVLQQLNYVLFKWKDKNNSMSDVQFEIISPMTGIYQLHLKHSTLFGYLEEDLIVKQGKENETILALQIRGSINSISNVDAKLSVKALGHSLSANIFNTPLSSVIEAKWDENSLMSNLQFKVMQNEITQVTWNVNSTFFTDFIKLQYYHIDSRYYILLRTPNGYELENNLDIEFPYDRVRNVFTFGTPTSKGGFSYEHQYKELIVNNSIKAYLNEDRIEYTGSIQFLMYTFLPSDFNLEVVSTWRDPIRLKFVLSEDDFVINRINLNILLVWDKQTTFAIDSFIKYDLMNNTLLTHVSGTHIDDIDINSSYNIDRQALEMTIKVKNVVSTAKITWLDVYLLLVEVKSENTQEFLLDVRYTSPEFKVKILLPRYKFESDLKINDITITGGLNWACSNSSTYALILNFTETEGFLSYKKNEKSFATSYEIKSTSIRDFDVALNTSSTFDFIRNATIIAKYNPNHLNILLEGSSLEYFLCLQSSFSLDINPGITIAKGRARSKFKIGDEEIMNANLQTSTELANLGDLIILTIVMKSEESIFNFTGFVDQYGLRRASLFAKNTDNVFTMNFENFKDNEVVLSGSINSPWHKLTGEVKSQRKLILGHCSDYHTFLRLTKDDQVYNGYVFTKYYSLLRSESLINFTSSDFEYNGFAVVNVNGARNSLNVSLNNSVHKNNLEFMLDIDGVNKMEGFLLLQSGFIALSPLKLSVNFNWESEEKELKVVYIPTLHDSSSIKLEVQVNKTNMWTCVDLPNRKQFLKLSGTYFIENDEVSVYFAGNYNSSKIRGEIFQTKQDFMQTKVDVATTIKGWEKTVFENKIDEDKVRTFFAIKNNHLSIVANKEAMFKGKEVLSVQYNGEQLLTIWSGRDRSYLITSTRYVKYRLGIQYVTDPQIYGFSILKDGENLISLQIMQNTNNSKYFSFKGKLIAPTLFPHYSNLSLHLHTDYHLSKDFEFALNNENTKLLEVKWSAKTLGKEFLGYFKFHSQIPMLELFEANPYINLENDVLIKSKVLFSQYGTQKELFNEIFIPLKSSEILLLSIYPCEEYGRCKLHLQVNKSQVVFHWTSPIENWKNISLNSRLELKNNSLAGSIFFEKNRKHFDVKMNVRLNSTSFDWNFNEASNFKGDPKTYAFEGNYVFYKQINFRIISGFLGFECYVVNGGGKTGQFTVVYRDTKTRINTSLERNKLNFLIDYDDGENGAEIIMNITAVKTNISHRSQNFDLAYFYRDAFWKGNFIYDFEEGYKFSGSLVNDTLIWKGEFTRGHGNFKLVERRLPLDMSLNYNFTENFESSFLLKVENQTVSNISAIHLCSENSLNSDVSIQFFGVDLTRLNLKYLAREGEVLGFLRLSLSPTYEFSFRTNLKHNQENYFLQNEIVWPQGRKITVLTKTVFGTGHKLVDLEINTPYTDQFKTSWKYDGTNKKINLSASTSLGEKNVTVNFKLILKSYLSINITSPFVGYTTGGIIVCMDEKNQSVYVRVEKENLLTEFAGNITKLENNLHEIHVTSKSLAESFAEMQMKLDRNSMKLSGDIIWRDEKMLVEMSYDPKDLYLNMDSSMDYVKKIRVSAIYTKNQNIYYLVSSGHWNSITFSFKGNASLDPNDLKINSELVVENSYEGKFDLEFRNSDRDRLFEFSAYFPRPSSNVYLKFSSERESGGSITSQIILKTPFEEFRSFLLTLENSNQEISTAVSINLHNKDLTAFMSLSFGERNLLGKLGFSIPQDDQMFNLELDVDLYKHGRFRLENVYEITVGYNISDDFEITLLESKGNEVETKIYLLYSEENTKFDWHVNDDVITVRKSSSDVLAKVDSLRYFKKVTNETIFYFYRNWINRNLNLTVLQTSLWADWDDSQVNVKAKNLLSGNLSGTYTVVQNGFEILILENDPPSEVRVIYLNNADEFLFSIDEDNKDRSIFKQTRFHFKKNLEKFELKASDKFHVDLELTKSTSRLHFLNYFPLAGEFIQCELDLSNSMFSFLLNMYSSININILTVIDLSKNRKLQFRYGGFKMLNAVNGIIELGDSLRVVFDKSGKEVFNLEYVVNEDLYLAKFYVEISNLVHRGNFKLVKSNPYLVQFEVSSPILPDEGFAIFGTASSFTPVFFSVGKRIPESPDSVEGQYLSITAELHHKSILVHLELPKSDLLRLLHYKTSWNYDIYKTLNEIKIVSSILGKVSVVGDFILEEEGLDLQVHLRLPFLKNFENFDSEFHVRKNSHPWFYIHLPNNKNYSAHVNFVNDNDRFLIGGGYTWVDSRRELKLDFNKSTPSFLAEIYLPFEKYKHYALTFERNKTRYVASINFNERLNRLELEYYCDLFANCNLLKIELVTPFQNYDKYYLHIKQKRDSQTQVFTCLLFYPGLDREIGFDLAHYLNRRVNYTISLPVSVYSFKRASFSADLLKVDEYLTIEARGELNSYNVKTSVLLGKSKNESKLDFELKTSEEHSIAILFNDQNDFLNTTLTYNGKHILKFDYSYSKDLLDFLCDTIWKSIKLNYEYQSLTQFNVSARIWDTSDPNHQFGGHFISTDRISVGLYLPNKTFTADEQYFINSTHEFYLLRFAWNKNDAFGVRIRFFNVSEDHSINVNSLIDLELPFRTFQLFYDLKIIQTSNIFTHFIFKWDQDSASEINWRSKFIENKLESKLSSTALDDDITLIIDFCRLNTIPSVFKLQLNYSSEEEKLIEVEVFYDKLLVDEVVTVERNFLIRQPASRINYAVNSKTIRTKESANLTVFLHYTDYILNKPESIKVSLEIGHSNFEIAGLIETKRNNLNIFTKSNTGTYYKGLEIEMKVNDKEPLNLNYVYNFKEVSPSFVVVMRYGKDRQYRMYSGLPSKRQIKAELMHRIYGNEYIDGLFTLKLNTSSLLWMKILWTDSLIEQFTKAIISEYSDLKYVVEATGRQLIDVVDKDFGKTFVKDARELRTKITTYGYIQKKEIIKDFSNFIQGIKDVCDRENTLLCRILEEIKTIWIKYNVLKSLTDPIFEMTADFYENILEILEQTYGSVVYIFDQIEQALNKLEDVQKLKSNAKELLKRSIHDARKSIEDMELLAVELLNDLEEYMNAIKNKCEELFEPLLSLLDDFVAYFENKLAFVQIIVLDTFDTIQQYIQRLEETKKLMEMYRALVSWLEKLHLLELVESVSDFIEAILNTVVNDTKHIIDDYRPYVDTLYATIFGDYQELKKLPEFSDFKEFVNRVYQKTIWIWNYHNVMENLKAYLHKLSSNLINYLNIFANEYTGNNEQENIFGQFDYTFRPDLGVIEISQPLPVEWESFDKAPCFEQYPLYQQIHNKIDLITRNRFDVYKNVIKTYVQYITKRVFSPSINNIAMVIGNSHFISFDRNQFDFVGNCSYLLASDFYSNAFSVIINFAERNGVHEKTSLTFMDSENKIDIMADDFGVVFNGAKVDLPLIAGDFIVTRENEYILAVENRKGLRTFCNFYFDYCTIEISEWLFGKTAGLLGTLDNEKFTDMMMPDGYRANTVEEFVDSWKLDDTCDGTNYANETKDYSGSLLVNRFFNTLCSKIFSDRKSPLSPCFAIVDSKPFYQMCLLDIRDKIKPTVCSATAAYKKQCKNQLVEVAIPNICISCQQSLDGNADTIFDGHNPKSIDVVFIQELDCLKNVIANLPKKLNAALQRKGYISNKFAIVGYGGQSSMKPHMYTFEKKIWSNENFKINTSMTFKWKPNGKYTAADAIKYAVDLNFRPALRKMFILIQCELCPEMDNSPEIYNMLGDKDIILHVLKPKPFERTQSDDIFALDVNNRTLSKEGVLKNGTNNDEVIDQLNDMCSGLALSTTGTLADAELLRSNRSLKSSWASFVSLSVKQSSCQKCKCIPDASGVGKVDCTRCMSPIVKQLLNEYESRAIEF